MTLDREGNIRPLTPRRFKSLSEAEEENGQSRIYLGIHWSFDKREGIRPGAARGRPCLQPRVPAGACRRLRTASQLPKFAPGSLSGRRDSRLLERPT